MEQLLTSVALKIPELAVLIFMVLRFLRHVEALTALHREAYSQLQSQSADVINRNTEVFHDVLRALDPKKEEVRR